MEIGYVSEENSKCVKQKLRYIFNIVYEKNIDGKTFFILPITNKTKLNTYVIRRLSKGLYKKLYKKDIEDVVLSKYLYNVDLLKNKLYGQNVDILDGKKLFKDLSYNILEYINKYKKEKIEEVSILVNDLSKRNVENIIYIAEKIKRLNIITNNIDKFKKLEDYLYEENGINITISNNKQKSLAKAKLIFNYDFPNELINKFKINANAVIINIPNDIKINSKRFEGVLVNDFNITIPVVYKLTGFSDEIMYESLIYKKDFEDLINIISKENITVKSLIGNNGKINVKELI